MCRFLLRCSDRYRDWSSWIWKSVGAKNDSSVKAIKGEWWAYIHRIAFTDKVRKSWMLTFLCCCLFRLHFKIWYLWGFCCFVYMWYAQWGNSDPLDQSIPWRLYDLLVVSGWIIKKICLTAGWWKICLLTGACGKRWTSKCLLVQGMENVSVKTNIVRVQGLWFKLRWMNTSLL